MLISWICMFMGPLIIPAVAAGVMTLILALNAKALFDEESAGKLIVPLWIQLGVIAFVFVLDLIALIFVFTLVGLIIAIPLFVFSALLCIGVAVWQVVLWNKIKDIQ